MALMKTGRSMPNGEDPKKPKANAEVKVTAKKQEEPPRKRFYTEEDYNKNEAVKSRNKAVREKYESETANYNKAMKLYTQGPEDSNEPGMKLPDAKLAKGQTATFSKDTNRYTAEKMNKDLQQKIKSGQVVAMDDPSLDATTRKILAGIHGSGRSSDLYGTPGKRYVDKGTKVSSYKEAYGEDFNPEEYRAASKSGNFDKYSKDKGYTGRSFVPKEGLGVYEEYGTPKQSAAPVYEKEEDIKDTDFMRKMPLLKPTLLKGTTGTIEGNRPKEKGDWQEPEGTTKYRTKYSLPDVSTTNKAKSLGRFVRSKVESIGKDNALSHGLKKEQGKARLIQGKTGREGEMAKAYFGAGYSNKPASTIRESKAELQGKKKEIKSDIRTARKEGVTKASMEDKRAELKDIKSGIKQANLAGKYLNKYDRNLTGANRATEAGGSIGAFTGKAMENYENSKQNTYDPNANKNALKEKRANEFMAFRSQLSNKANQNTVANQEKALSFKERVASDKAERQNAPSFKEKREKRKADTILQKATMEKLKNK